MGITIKLIDMRFFRNGTYRLKEYHSCAPKNTILIDERMAFLPVPSHLTYLSILLLLANSGILAALGEW